MTYPEQVKSLLWSDIQEMSKCPGRYAKNPEVDFSRKRKIDFENLMRFLISMESGTTAHELLKYFDYDIEQIQHGYSDEYPLSLRIVRFETTEGVFQNIITNLPAGEFPDEEIKLLYHMRWGIETSFRDLKHTIGTINFHSKKVEYVEQEIWGRLILFNFCAIITKHVVIVQKDTKHAY